MLKKSLPARGAWVEITVSYSQGYHEPFKVKSHSSNRRAYKAIEDTVRNNGFAF